MKSREWPLVFVIAILIALALPGQLAAQHSRYKLIDVGTFGGPASYLTDPGNGPSFLVLNNAGMLVGRASTSTPDPNFPNFCYDNDCFLQHAFLWADGTLTDLG